MTLRAYYEPLIDEPELKQRIRERHRARIRQLQALGFKEYGFVREKNLPGMMLPVLLLAVPMMWMTGDVIRYRPPFAIESHHPVLARTDCSTYAFTFSMGVKYSTLFTDGTALMTTTYVVHDHVISPEKQFYRYEYAVPPAKALNLHLSRIKQFESDGLQVCDTLSFDDYARICYRDDELTMGMSVPKHKRVN